MQQANILLTGKTGFLGKYIFRSIAGNGNTVYSTVRDTSLKDSGMIICNLETEIPVLPDIAFTKIIHVAGKAHSYPKTTEEADEMYQANLSMTNNLLAGLEKLTCKPEQIIFISSVAVYGINQGVLIGEAFALNPDTAYGKAKLASEQLLQNWCAKKGVNLLVLRLPLIAGINPPGNLGAIQQAIKKGRYLKVQNNLARKSIVLASDVAQLIRDMENNRSGVYHLTDRVHPSISEIETAIAKAIQKKIRISLPFRVVKWMAHFGDFMESITGKPMPINSNRFLKLTAELTFDDDKAVKELSWSPNSSLDFLSDPIMVH